jgi:hypothetical protein
LCAAGGITPAVAQDVTAAALSEQIAASPASAPAAVTKALKAAGSNAQFVAGPLTAAAIQALGREAPASKIAAIVYAAVRTVPDSALRIVRAAVKIAPSAAPEIAAAAARAVPNPWKEVRYQRDAPETTDQYSEVPPANREPDFKSPSFEDGLAAVLDPPAPGTPMTLAEAIVQAAFDTAGHSGLAAVQGAVDTALYGDPGSLFSTVGDPRGISGVGTVGNSNYANEPRLPGTSTGGAPPGDPPLLVPPPPQPTPPAVSP